MQHLSLLQGQALCGGKPPLFPAHTQSPPIPFPTRCLQARRALQGDWGSGLLDKCHPGEKTWGGAVPGRMGGDSSGGRGSAIGGVNQKEGNVLGLPQVKGREPDLARGNRKGRSWPQGLPWGGHLWGWGPSRARGGGVGFGVPSSGDRPGRRAPGWPQGRRAVPGSPPGQGAGVQE